ncbi:MAG: peptidase M15A [Marinobacter sp.]|nr:MAG: peptidase M15A [Marinobacter sp.]
MQLSPNFFLDEFTHSQAAARHGIDIRVSEGDAVYDRLLHLASIGLQPARDALGPVFVSSGYRPEALNRAIGGSPSSAHIDGRAADIVVVGHSPLAVAQWFADSDVPFDQVIHEFGRWVHVGMARPSETPRRQLLTAVRKPGRTIYVRGLHSVDDALARVA